MLPIEPTVLQRADEEYRRLMSARPDLRRPSSPLAAALAAAVVEQRARRAGLHQDPVPCLALMSGPGTDDRRPRRSVRERRTALGLEIIPGSNRSTGS